MVLTGANHQEKLQKIQDQEAAEAEKYPFKRDIDQPKDQSKLLALVYMLMVYGLGFLFALLPSIYMNHWRGTTEREMIQSKSLASGYKLICGLQTNE